MAMFKANFVIGVLVGVALAIAAPLLGTELFATLSAPASANSAGTSDATIQQTVNRADKSDRLKPSHDAIQNRLCGQLGGNVARQAGRFLWQMLRLI